MTATAEAATTDWIGQEHGRAGGDVRIACLVPSITELLFALGLGPHLVARTRYCIHPAAEVAGVPAVGGTKKVHLARLRTLAPTHVILNVDENTAEMADALREFVPHLVVTHPMEPRDNLRLYRLMGAVFGREGEAGRLCEAFERAYAELTGWAAGRPQRRVLYLIWKDPWMTVSADTYVSRTLALAGFATVPDEAAVRYPQVEMTPELLGATDAVLFSTEPYAFDEGHLAAFARDHGAVGTLPALSLIDGEYTSWYGVRAIEGMRYLRSFAERLQA